MCREHATVVIDEYRTKLGERWTFREDEDKETP